MLEELDRDYDGKVKFAKLNVDEQNDLATRYKCCQYSNAICISQGQGSKATGRGCSPRKN